MNELPRALDIWSEMSYHTTMMKKDVTVQEVLQSLLQYEGGEMQSMNEWFYCQMSNDAILAKAKELDIVLDTSEIGRKK